MNFRHVCILIVKQFKTLKEIKENRSVVEEIRNTNNLFEKETWSRIKLNKQIIKIPNSKKDIKESIKDSHIEKKYIDESLKKIKKDKKIKKVKLKKIFRMYGLRKFRLQLLVGKRNFGKLLGLEII